ncbi:hypothetical protein SVAN01_02465 [Stagonosporopsis vannaccii]|nr:hypothetical protein SVAN01_02465 [Stagonosporopsis vannaccii]
MRVEVAGRKIARNCTVARRPPPVLHQRQYTHSQDGLQRAVESKLYLRALAATESHNANNKA